jgi:hypothetical protein
MHSSAPSVTFTLSTDWNLSSFGSVVEFRGVWNKELHLRFFRNHGYLKEYEHGCPFGQRSESALAIFLGKKEVSNWPHSRQEV